LPKETLVVPKPYSPEFRRRALDLLSSGRTVRDVAASLGIAESCLHRWKSQDLTDRGLKCPSPGAVESAALAAAQRRIAELEDEVKILRKAAAAVHGASTAPQPAHSAGRPKRLPHSRAARTNRPNYKIALTEVSTVPGDCHGVLGRKLGTLSGALGFEVSRVPGDRGQES
jgi:transposase-like protein